MLLVMLIILTMTVVEVILLKFPKIRGDFGAGNDFLGVDLVESIDKGSIFGLVYNTNR